MEKSLFSRYHLIHSDTLIKDNIKSKLISIYFLYSSSRKLWTKKNFNKLHLIANNYESISKNISR
jgi:hypothetical protein